MTDKHDPETGEVLDHKGRRLNSDGQELPDPSSLAPPIGFIKQPPLHELIRQMVRSEQLRREAETMDAGSFDDEDDFEVDDSDNIDPSSPWEENFDPLPEPGVAGGEPPAAAAEAPAAPPAEPKAG